MNNLFHKNVNVNIVCTYASAAGRIHQSDPHDKAANDRQCCLHPVGKKCLQCNCFRNAHINHISKLEILHIFVGR